MTVDQMQSRVRELRDLPPPRTAGQEAELAALVQALLAAGDDALGEATRRMRQEREAAEVRVRSLERLAARRTALAATLERTLAEARAERRSIDAELASVLTDAPGPAGG
jgi:hypothetical protein